MRSTYAAVFIAFVITQGCKPIEVMSQFAVADGSAVAPPAKDYISEQPKTERTFYLANDGGVTRTKVSGGWNVCDGDSCYFEPDLTSGNLPSSDSSFSETNPQVATKPDSAETPVGDSPPAVPATPEVNSKAEKWFTGKKTSYYLPLKDNPNVLQLFDAKTNKPRDWYFDKKNGMLGQGVGFDENFNMQYNADSDLYKMSRVSDSKGSWQGVGKVYKDKQLTDSGVTYYYGNFADDYGTKGWGQRFQINDPEKFKSHFSGSATADYLQNAEAGSGLWFQHPPQTYNNINNIKILSIPSNTPITNFWAKAQTSESNVQQQTGDFNKMPSTKPMSYGGYPSGTKIYLSATDCGACSPERQRAAVAAGAIPVGEPKPGQKQYTMSELNRIYGPGSFPRTITVP